MCVLKFACVFALCMVGDGMVGDGMVAVAGVGDDVLLERANQFQISVFLCVCLCLCVFLCVCL
jgi:hypothetical protein